ncbi:hypothetical protein ncot_13420 [Nocardioides sp. JQ2195]|uniref:choice-of-anchor P family protein n=1 Tax=Nocardioides sp. JQ2195 TaxID=2592334 RepID=UPI00143ED3D4|nr:choice-of-anchor P family protein [Nocardioides sp. JQ2195]QIX27497.1 hypothetical protein ncot_13420 [Nocardioides sp. JQ2195]
MSPRRMFSVPVLLLMVIGLFAAPSQAEAPANASRGYAYYSAAGGTMVRALGTTISSDLTAQSTIAGQDLPSAKRSAVAAVDVDNLVDVGAVHTKTRAEKAGAKGIKLISTARTANVSLLNGLIRAEAVVTKNVTKGTPRGLKATSRTRFVDLRISGVRLPVDIPKNFRVQIPGVAAVVLNSSVTGQKDGVVSSQGYAIGVWLLKDRGPAPLGSSIILNPTMSALSVPVPGDAPAVGGDAYGTSALIKATSKVRGEVGRTGEVATPPISTGGRTNQNRTADVDIPGILHVGAISSTTTSTSSAHRGEVTNTNRIAGLNVLNGLIRADAIFVKAHSKLRGERYRKDEKMTFVNLVIAGQRIPIDVGRNTTIKVGNVANVVVNQRARTPNGNKIRGLFVKLLQPRSGLEAGARIEIAVASTRIWH